MPSDEVQKILLSTPARFTGEFRHEDLVLTHAWPPLFRGRRDWLRHQESPIGRTAFVLSFRTKPVRKAPGVVVPNYEIAGDFVASALSVLFGKRFDAHGPLEMSGHFGVPDMRLFGAPVDPRLPYMSGRARVDFPVPLEMSQARRIQALLLSEDGGDRKTNTFHGAAAFYRRALQAIEDDPEVAYLHLITAGEIISNSVAFDPAKHLDDDIRAALSQVASGMPDGDRLERILLARLRGIKRRFVDAITSLIDDDFFARNETVHGFGGMPREDFARRIAAAYDLRSQHVHTGYDFGRWIAPSGHGEEVQLGKPVVPDKEMAKVLARAPLFAGLERVLRYSILNFGRQLGLNLEGLAPASSADESATPE